MFDPPMDDSPSYDELVNTVLEQSQAIAALKAEVEKFTSTNSQSDAIALVCEMGKIIDDKGDLPLWAYRNQARIRTVCIAQQHT